MTQESPKQTPSPDSRYPYLQQHERQQIHDFDNADHLEAFVKRVENQYSKNFFLDFGLEEAWCGFDLEAGTWEKLLQNRTAESDPRWIQIWCPHEHRDLIKGLATRYGLSPRLTELMLTKPNASELSHTDLNTPRSPRFHLGRSPKAPVASAKPASDEEHGTVTASGSLINESIPTPRVSSKPIDELNHYDIADSIWHLQSVDVGSRYTCLGYNTLYDVKPNMKEPQDGESIFAGDLPDAHRVWHWIMLCDDNMVVSITESVTPDATSIKLDTPALRDNLRNVFRQLSRANDHPKQKSVSLAPIRMIMDREKDSKSGAGLLLYYIFDDWLSTFRLLAKRDNAYSTKLSETRRSMMEKADLKHVELLHRLGRQLAVLRRLYLSYQLIVAKVLERHRTSQAPLKTVSLSNAPDESARLLGGQSLLSTQSSRNVLGSFVLQQQPSSSALNSRVDRDSDGTYLSPSALDRFERLGDRISLFVLTEIEESINLKDQLLAMNFNLITIKQSDSVERLTRITILLAKVTILVLPVTLMTGYFSVQIPNTSFTITKYWISFAVILIFSFLGLIFFGQVSKTVEGGLVYKTFFGALMFLPKRLKLIDTKKKDKR